MRHLIFIALLMCTATVAYGNLAALEQQALHALQEHSLEQAIDLYTQLLHHQPQQWHIAYNLAYAYKLADKPEQAIPLYQQVIAHNPNYAAAHIGIAQCYLIQGNFGQGWQEFSWRLPELSYLRTIDWSSLDFAGKTILVRGEWGLGDQIQFVRFCKLLKERGARVIIQTYDSLKPLFSHCPYLDAIICSGDPFPDYDLQLPLLSLPHALRSTLSTLPTEPYLHADKRLVKIWQQKLATDINYKIGICWRGRGDINAHKMLNRNIPLNCFMPLTTREDAHLYALQKIDGLEELAQLPTGTINCFESDFDESHGRFMDTAAVMQTLDLIISADTSIAHLAGALGKPVWLLLPYKADWRWMMNRTDSPWYPTMRIFRQEQPGDWHQVIEQVMEALNQQIVKKEVI